MSEHLSNLLARTGQVGLVWDIHSDDITWLGEAASVLHLMEKALPVRGAALKKLLNPQDLPAFMSELQGRVQRLETDLGAQEISSILRITGHDGAMRAYRLQGHIVLEGADAHPVIHALLIDLRAGQKYRLSTDEDGVECVEETGRDAMIDHIDRARMTKGVDAFRGFLFVLGLDRIRLLNTAYGAHAIDTLFTEVERRLNDHTGPTAFVARLSGDNFGILCPDMLASDVATFVSGLQHVFRAQPFRTMHGSVTVGLTIGGAALMGTDIMNAQDALAQAETALFEAKAKGRGSFVLARPRSEKKREAQALLDTAQTALEALHQGRMRLAFQPVINFETAKPSFYECLIRIVDTDGKLVAASKFVPALETLGLMRELDIFALRAAVHELVACSDLRLSVNVSATSLTDEAWVRAAVAELSDRPEVAKRLIVEITESAVMDDIDEAARILGTLRTMGCSVALDDFGAGQTSFRQLKRLNVSVVKIDAEYVHNMHDPVNRLFITALFELAKGLGLETVAEGAETMDEASELHTQGITHIQGFAYGQPSIHRLWLDDDSERAMLNLPSF